MVNPLVRIAAVEGGDQIKRALAALVHPPSSSQQSPPSEGYRKIWKDTGCTIMSDGWIDKKRRTLINFLVYCPQGMVFLKSVDVTDSSKTGEYLFRLFASVVQFAGPENVVPFVTDNASNM